MLFRYVYVYKWHHYQGKQGTYYHKNQECLLLEKSEGIVSCEDYIWVLEMVFFKIFCF